MVMGITTDQILSRYPRLYHMANGGSWESIKKHGLLSTSGLLDLFEIEGTERSKLELYHRPESMQIRHPKYGSAIIRDQKPMSDEGLVRALSDGLTPSDWYQILNSKVFFWLTAARLNTFVNARAYRNTERTVLVLDTKLLLSRHEEQVWLAPLNTGCTKPVAHKRGSSTFQRMDAYPYEELKNKRASSNIVVELAVDYSVSDIEELVVEVNDISKDGTSKTIWKR